MKYDFSRTVDRRGTDSLKWDSAGERGRPEGLLSLWVADMDFPAPPEVLSELQRVMEPGIFGYTEPKDDYYDALSRWFSSRFSFEFGRDDVVKTPGVVFALAAAVRAYAGEGEGVLIQTPVYYPFYEVIRSNGRKLVTNPLLFEEGKCRIDFDDLERKIREEDVKLFLLCSPHNPAGRVWTRDELDRIYALCRQRGVQVVSDEIHCDFVWPGHSHTCFGLIDGNAVVATAPSKTFNLAGLQVSNIIVKNPERRRSLEREIGRTGYSQLNLPGLAACRSAYSCGAEWLEELKMALGENIRLTGSFLKEKLPCVGLTDPQGTYLLWLDFRSLGLGQAELDRIIVEEAGLWLDSGTMFGREGRGFQRMNIACSRALLCEALEKLERAFR